MIIRFIFLAICFLLSVLQTSHARDFQRQRDIIEAEYRANVRFAQGDGFVVDIPLEHIDMSDSPMISVCTNSPEERIERLRQEELYKIGESTPQRVARFIPVIGTVVDHHYDRVSEREFFSTLGIDSICLAATTSKAISYAKQASTAKFARNLNARFNQAPYNPRAMERMIIEQYAGVEVASKTMPKSNAKNVKLAGTRHPETNIVFNHRGMPVFDDIAKVEVMLPVDVAKIQNRNLHFSEATKQLKNLIEEGKVSKSKFNRAQLDAIYDNAVNIPDFIWHHHEDFQRMQLIPRVVHEKTGHVGGFNLWFE